MRPYCLFVRRICGLDLMQVCGLNLLSVLMLISETGVWRGGMDGGGARRVDRLVSQPTAAATGVGVNNSRFLLLPWVQCHNLGSWVLGRVGRQLPQDWQNRYGYEPVLLESFVETQRFAGTCYRAANWLCLGQTLGRRKLEKSHACVLLIKDQFVRPLRSDFRDLLCR